jgi:predicted HicB family RNase H-like nuclease
MPAELKEKLAAEVARAGASLNDVAVGILASRFAVPFEPSGRRGTAPKAKGDVLLRMPPALKEKLQTRAAERGRGTNDLIVEILGERLGAVTPRKERMPSRNGS